MVAYGQIKSQEREASSQNQWDNGLMTSHPGRCTGSDSELRMGCERDGGKKPERSEKLQKFTWGKFHLLTNGREQTSPGSAKAKSVHYDDTYVQAMTKVTVFARLG